ncbi:hypothetical protein G6W57_01205 [Streptomyces sp. CAI-121]|uniref:hypothetical protein n=2 Tax=unclassified Streptomyces TaxID=2593676 RepID=UPI001587724D|nr:MULTISPECIES: hypothetical protein [unclassified Streptomyces]NUV65733.1 hypothetical protein [Streptomyces sp. CAI-121]NUW12470.1 hypothetical protein [Streptomyces sp. CAI-68]
MPDNTLVWVDRQPSHSMIYVDRGLFSSPGTLSALGLRLVNDALAALIPGWSLGSAPKCDRTPLYAVAG